MKRSLFFIFALLFTASSFVTFSQSASVFTPFVSRIKAESGRSSVKLSWKDTLDVKGNCVIYRHTSVINDGNIDEAVKIARVPQGVEFYEDFPPYVQTGYFYAVLMEGEDSLLHKVYIPFRNITQVSASITEKTRDETPALVTGLKASPLEDSILLSFKSSKPSSELFLYRNTEPIEDQNDILSANLIATLPGSASSYTDYPVPGISYYYGIIDSNLIKTGSYIFKAGENITLIPAEIAIKSTERVGLPEIAASRPRPLPYLSISRGFQSGRILSQSVIESIPEKQPVSQETMDLVDRLKKSIHVSENPKPGPVILKQDLNAAEGSERGMLRDILENDFTAGNFDSAMIKLLDFQKVKRDRDIEASIHFYLGQINYFLGDYRSSFREFLFAEEYYYSESKPWIDSLFGKLRKG